MDTTKILEDSGNDPDAPHENFWTHAQKKKDQIKASCCNDSHEKDKKCKSSAAGLYLKLHDKFEKERSLQEGSTHENKK